MLIIALSAPILGSMADYSRKRKKYLLVYVIGGIFSTGLLVFIGIGQWLMASVLYILGRIGFGGGNVFYDSLLPYVAKNDNIDQVSIMGYALGYLGGGFLLSLNLSMILRPKVFFIPDYQWAMRLSFLSVSFWWALFSIPILFNVPEPDGSDLLAYTSINLIKEGLRDLVQTFRQIIYFKEAFKFLLAFWLYSDGIGTVIIMATVFGREIGIGYEHLIGAILLVQLIGFPFSIAFGKLATIFGTKLCILIGIIIYIVISVLGYFMKTPLHFWYLAILVGMVQGGTQALSRSFFGRLIPRQQSAKFFAFYDLSSKFAGIVGPALFGLIGQITGSSRYGIISLIIFFLGGGGVLIFVNTDKVEK